MTFRLLVLLKDHPSSSQLNKLITFSYEGVSVIGIEYNLVLGIEKIQSFTPRLIVLDEAMIPMPTGEFVEIIRQYSKNFQILLLSDKKDKSTENLPNIHSIIKRDSFNTEALKSFIESAAVVFKENKAAETGTSIHDPSYYNYIHNLISTLGFSPKTLTHLTNEFGWNLSERVLMTLLYPMANELTVRSDMLDDIQAQIDGFHGGAVFLKNNCIGVIVNTPSDSGDSRLQERDLLKHIQRRIESNYETDYVFLISKRIKRSELENYAANMLTMRNIGYFCKNIHAIHMSRNASDYRNKSRDLPEDEISELYHSLFREPTDKFINALRSFYTEHLKKSFSKEMCLKFRCQLELLNHICMYHHPYALTEENISTAKKLFGHQYQIIEDEMEDAVSLFRAWNIYINNVFRPVNEHVLNSAIYLIMHCEDPVSLEELASSVSVSPSHLSHLFNKEIKMTFNEIRTTLRMIYAKRLLRSGHYKIYEIAKMCGYADYRYFCNNFKKTTGITPTEFRDLYFASLNRPHLEII